MTDTPTPDTSPEAVGATCQELLDTCKGQPAKIPWPHRPQHKAVATLRALSAERDELKQSLEKAVMACGEQARARGEAEGRLAVSEMAGVVGGWKARAEAAEAERDALRAELAEAKMHVAEMITAFEEHVALPDKNCSCHISPPCGDCTENDYARETLSEARAFLARHQNETDT